jgi:hypothetical protein
MGVTKSAICRICKMPPLRKYFLNGKKGNPVTQYQNKCHNLLYLQDAYYALNK